MEYRKDQNIVDKLSTVLGQVALWSTPFVVAIIFYEVVMRYIFVNPTMWVNELSLWVCGTAYLFAGLYAMRHRNHIRIFILYDLVPRWLQRIFDSISVACLAVFTFGVVWGSYSEALRKLLTLETYGTAWDPPIPGTVKPLILTFLVLILIQAIANLISDWNKSPVHHEVTDEVDLEAIRATTLGIENDDKQ